MAAVVLPAGSYAFLFKRSLDIETDDRCAESCASGAEEHSVRRRERAKASDRFFDQNSASWNLITSWLRRVDGLRLAGC